MRDLSIPPPFTCPLEHEDGRAVIRPTGEVDLATARALEARLQEALALQTDEIVLDLRGVDFLGSTGLRVLVGFAESATEGGRRFAIVRGPRAVQRVIELTGVEELLPLVDG